MLFCYFCGEEIQSNIYKAYDKSFCCNLCRNNVVDYYVYTHELKIVEKHTYEQKQKYINSENTKNMTAVVNIKKTKSTKNLSYDSNNKKTNNNKYNNDKYNRYTVLKKNIYYFMNIIYNNIITTRSISSLIYPISKPELDYCMPKQLNF